MVATLRKAWETRGSDPAPFVGVGEGGNVISVRDVTVRFGGLVANNDVSLNVTAGQITTLIGPNGAGKSTLFDVITGARIPATGSVAIAGQDVTRMSVHQRARLGVARTFQNLAVSKEMTVFENVQLGAARFLGYGAGAAILGLPTIRKRDRAVSQYAQECLAEFGLGNVSAVRVGSLPYGDQRRVELARALAMRPRVMLLDEPAAGMGPEETDLLALAVCKLRDERAMSVLVVEHDLDFVRRVGDIAYVLDFGTVMAHGTVAQVLADPDVQAAYMGKDAEDA